VITGISKVVVPVANPDEATRFWTQVIGFRLLRDQTYRGERWIEVEPPDRSLVLVLHRRPANKPGGEVPNTPATPRVFFRCDDIEQTYAELRGTGLSFLTARAQKHMRGWVFQDPEGTRFVLEQRGWPADVNHLRKQATTQVRGGETSGDRPMHGRTPAAGLRAGAHSMVFHHPAGQAIEQHGHPAWKIIIPDAGQVFWKNGQRPATEAAGVIFPPQLAHAAATAARYAVVLIDPWFLGLGPGHGDAIPLDPSTVAQIRSLWDQDGEDDPDDCARATVAFLRRRELLPKAVSIDPRVASVLRNLPMANGIQDLAAAVGLSPSRLRALVRDQTGTPPAQLRRWQRLRAAIGNLPRKPIALAASDAGFADQAHLTRTATQLVGQTPGDLVAALNVPARLGKPSQARDRDTASVSPTL
jgi:AraC-like DNA-binding protein/catechol 2,3-dioxygenase-like lactoylglutathione lyase family enzyme